MFPLNLMMFRNITIDNTYRIAAIFFVNTTPIDQNSLYPGFSFLPVSFLHSPSDGTFQGGSARLLSSLRDFSFILSFITHHYFLLVPPWYHLISIVLLDLFPSIDNSQHMPLFVLPLYCLGNCDRAKNYSMYG